MDFALWRRIKGLSDDEIDIAIDEKTRHAQELVEELSETLDEQEKLLKRIRKKGHGDDSGSQDLQPVGSQGDR